MYNEVIKLVSYTETTDEYGRVRRNEVLRDVFCDVLSIGTAEFYQAASSGLKPEYKFVIADYMDYTGEKEVEYEGVRYSIKRTYRTGRELELTAYGLNE